MGSDSLFGQNPCPIEVNSNTSIDFAWAKIIPRDFRGTVTWRRAFSFRAMVWIQVYSSRIFRVFFLLSIIIWLWSGPSLGLTDSWNGIILLIWILNLFHSNPKSLVGMGRVVQKDSERDKIQYKHFLALGKLFGGMKNYSYFQSTPEWGSNKKAKSGRRSSHLLGSITNTFATLFCAWLHLK